MADINIKVGLQGAAEVKAQMGYIEAAAKSFADKLNNKLVSTFSAVAVGAMAFDKLLESVNKNISAAKQITSLSTKFHLDPKAVHSMMIAANNAGVAIRTLLQAMKQLTKYADGAMAKGGGNKDMMKQMFGFDANGKELAEFEQKLADISKAPAKFLPEVAMQLAKINNEQDKTKMGTALLGRQYQQLIPLLEQLAESEEARKNFLENGSAMSAEQIEQAKKLGAATSDLQNAWDKFAASLFPVLTMLTNGVILLSSWVSQIKLIGQAWRNEIVQENARVNDRIVKYEGALRASASSGKLSELEKADLQKAKDNGMTQEEWINRRVKEYGKKQWDEAKNKNDSSSGWRTAAGIGMIAGAIALGVATGGVGLGVLALGGYGAYTTNQGIEGLTSGSEEVNKAQKEQEEAYEKEIKARQQKFGRQGTFEEKTKRSDERIAKFESKRKALHDKYWAKWKGSIDSPDNGTEEEQENYILGDSDYQKEIKQLRKDNPVETTEEFNAPFMPDDYQENSPIGMAYNWLVQKGAAASEKEISDKMIELGLSEKDAIAGLRSFFTGQDWYYDRTKGEYVRGKKPPEKFTTIKDINLNWKAEDKKKRRAREKMLKGQTRRQRQLALAQMRSNPETSSQEEAVMAGEMNIVNAKEDIETANLDFSGKKDILEDESLSDAEKEKKLAEVENVTEQRESADENVEKKKEALLIEMEQQKLLKEREKILSGQSGLSDTARKAFDDEIKANNEKVEKAKNDLATAQTAQTAAELKENEAKAAVDKAEIDLANAITAHAKAVEQMWLYQNQKQQQARQDEEEWENHILDLKYKNMKKLGYSQSQIAEEQLLDAQERFEAEVKNQEALESQIEESLNKRKDVLRKELEAKGFSDEAIDRELNEKINPTEAEESTIRDGEKRKQKAQIAVDNALENWEKIKPRAVVSELGRVGGGSAFQIGGSGPTDLLKEQVKLQRQLVKNTTKEPKVDKDKGSLTWGNKAVWGKKQPINR
jgi:hypothetical protein